jgi:hypothetical protein
VLCFIDAWQAFIIMLDQSFFLTDLSWFFNQRMWENVEFFFLL